MQTLDTYYQKDIYVLINAEIENQVFKRPGTYFWDAKRFLGEVPQEVVEHLASDYHYLSDINGIVPRPLTTPSTAVGAANLSSLYTYFDEKLPQNSYFPYEWRRYSPFPYRGADDLTIPGDLPQPVLGYDIGFLEKLTLGNYTTSNGQTVEVELPVSLNVQTIMADGTELTYPRLSGDGLLSTYTKQMLESDLSSPDNFVVHRHSFFYQKLPGAAYFKPLGSSPDRVLNVDTTRLRYSGSGTKQYYNPNFSFFLLYKDYYPSNKQNFSLTSPVEIAAVIWTANLTYLVWSHHGNIRYVQVYQRIPENITPYSNGTYPVPESEIAHALFKRYIYIGTFTSEIPNAVGFDIIFIHPNFLTIRFYDSLGSPDYLKHVQSFFSAITRRYHPPETVVVRPSRTVQRKDFADIPITRLLKLAYTYTSNEGKRIEPDFCSTVRIYTRADRTVIFGFYSLLFPHETTFVSGDKNLLTYLSPVHALHVVDGGFKEVGYLYSDFHLKNRFADELLLEKIAHSITPIAAQQLAQSSSNLLAGPTIFYSTTDWYQAGIFSNDFPTAQSPPLYRFQIHVRSTHQIPADLSDIPLRTVPYAYPFFGLQVQEGGFLLPGVRPTRTFIIPPQDILSVSITRGSFFNEHATIEIRNANGKYDALKNLTRYQVLITLDYSREAELNPLDELRFYNSIPAEELGISPYNVVIFRGVSDYETPLEESRILYAEVGSTQHREEKIRLHVQGKGHLLRQAVAIIAESFNGLTHIEAIREILFRTGFDTENLFITDYENPFANVRLMPPIPMIQQGYLLEPPNNYADFARKIVNEFSGWLLFYRHITGTVHYIPRQFRVDKTNPIRFHTNEGRFLNAYFTNPLRHLRAVDEMSVKHIRPIATEVILYAGTSIPSGRTDYVATNRRAVEDPTYEFYVGRNIPVFVFNPVPFEEVAKQVLKALAFRMLFGHKILNVRCVGNAPGPFHFCYVDDYGWGIIKSSSFDYRGSEKIMRSDVEIELVNHRDEQGNEYVIFYDEM